MHARTHAELIGQVQLDLYTLATGPDTYSFALRLPNSPQERGRLNFKIRMEQVHTHALWLSSSQRERGRVNLGVRMEQSISIIYIYSAGGWSVTQKPFYTEVSRNDTLDTNI